MIRTKLHLIVDNTQRSFLWECPLCFLSGTITVLYPDPIDKSMARMQKHHNVLHKDCKGRLVVLTEDKQDHPLLFGALAHIIDP
jgi:hypothetical protein